MNRRRGHPQRATASDATHEKRNRTAGREPEVRRLGSALSLLFHGDPGIARTEGRRLHGLCPRQLADRKLAINAAPRTGVGRGWHARLATWGVTARRQRTQVPPGAGPSAELRPVPNADLPAALAGTALHAHGPLGGSDDVGCGRRPSAIIPKLMNKPAEVSPLVTARSRRRTAGASQIWTRNWHSAWSRATHRYTYASLLYNPPDESFQSTRPCSGRYGSTAKRPGADLDGNARNNAEAGSVDEHGESLASGTHEDDDA